MNTEREQLIKSLLHKLSTDFSNLDLLNQALTHRSYSKERQIPNGEDNERLEFLGDAVLKCTIAEFLFRHYPEKNEGELSKLQSMYISDSLLASKARGLDLGKYILFGPNELSNDGRNNDSILANALESIFAAFFLDGGLDAARHLILHLLSGILSNEENIDFLKDYKSTLQEYTQHFGDGLPIYEVILEDGPPHHRTFEVRCTIPHKEETLSETGQGKSKKIAEQEAAKRLCIRLKLS